MQEQSNSRVRVYFSSNDEYKIMDIENYYNVERVQTKWFFGIFYRPWQDIIEDIKDAKIKVLFRALLEEKCQ